MTLPVDACYGLDSDGCPCSHQPNLPRRVIVKVKGGHSVYCILAVGWKINVNDNAIVLPFACLVSTANQVYQMTLVII